MDGVLIDSGAHHRHAWRALLAELGTEPADPEHWRLTIGRPSEEAIPLLLGRRMSGVEARRLARRKRDLYQERAQAGLEPVPGVPQFLESLARLGVPRAVGTSASRWDAERLLDDLGLLRYFDVVVTSDDVMLGKPDPEVWTQAARRLRAAPAACVVFEDALVGVQAAPSGPSPTSRDSSGAASPSREHGRLLGRPLRGRPGRLGPRRARAGFGRLAGFWAV